MGGNSSQSIDRLKRAFIDLVHELHARKLAIPAAAVLVAIVAAMFVLPKSPAPPPPAASAPVATHATQTAQPAMVSLKLVNVTPLDENAPLNTSSDPFSGGGKPKCTRVGSGSPKRFLCRIGNILVGYVCLPGVDTGICASGSGSTAATGASSSTGGSPSTGGGSTGGGTNPSPSPSPTPTPKKTTYHEISATIDGHTYSHVVAGDGLPDDSNALAVFAGVNSSSSKAIFIAGDGVTVTGVTVDPQLGNFELAPGKSATITDVNGVDHTLTLKSITKVTK